MNRITKALKIKLIELTIKKNRILGRLGLLPSRTQTYGPLEDILKNLTASSIDIQLHKADEENKDYIFSVIDALEKNGIHVTLTEFDKIFSNDDIQNISKISKTARINFRYAYPNYYSGKNVSAEMPIDSYLEILKKIKHLVKVATSNFTTKEEQIVFIARQLSEYTSYNFEYEKKSEEQRLRISSLQGCLEDRSTICAGVALAFERCMTELQVENMIIMGYDGKENDSPLRINHSWNKVKINDKWYNVDVTNILTNVLSKSKITTEERIKMFLLSSDKTLANLCNINITDSTNIPDSKDDFARALELYKKLDMVKNVLEEYDNGNMSTFLQYKVDDNSCESQKDSKDKKIEKDR